MTNPPKVLIINYDENNKSPDKDEIDKIINKLAESKCDMFILATQDSPSGGIKSHIQKSIGNIIKNSKKNKLFKHPHDDILKKYKLLLKVDGTRDSNVKKKKLFEDLYNVRMRVFINQYTIGNTIFKSSKNKPIANVLKNANNKLSQTNNHYNNIHSKIRYNLNETEFTKIGGDSLQNIKNIKIPNNKLLVQYSLINKTLKEDNSKKPSLNQQLKEDNSKKSNLIEIVKYSYRRITKIGKNGEKGEGFIMINIILQKDGESYQYIICNSNPIKYYNKNKKYIYINTIRNKNFNQKFIEEKKYKYITSIIYMSKDITISKQLNKGKNYNYNNVKYLQQNKPINTSKPVNTGLILVKIDKTNKKSFF
jgi:hypothetical protein